MFVGMIECDVLFGDVHSLKQKRAVLRPLLARLRRLEVSVAEVGDADLHRRASIGVAVVSGEAAAARRVLEECERIVADEMELQLLSVRRRLLGPED